MKIGAVAAPAIAPIGKIPFNTLSIVEPEP